MAQPNANSTPKLLAWAPDSLPPMLAAVWVKGPELTQEGWMNALEARVQDLINQEPAAAQLVARVLEQADPPVLDRQNRAAWAETLFQAVPAIKETLNQNSQTWPVQVTASDPEMEVLLREATLEDWLTRIAT